ncbi:hypothetical protein chiPu_0017989, partial [Chiloscyllium punctatum]|nr:hypothetical protein [Chiloscyllium punctatum]
VKRLQAFNDDVNKLSLADSFMVLLLRVPSYALRVEAMVLKEEFSPACFTLYKEMRAIRTATKELMACEELHAILHLVLQAGNIMNAGGHAGNAVGFKLSSLLKLADTKANKPGMNLLHFVVLEAQKKDANLSVFPEKLKHVQEAARLSVDSIDGELQSLVSRTKWLQVNLKQDFELLQQMEDFTQQALKEVDKLEREREDLQRETNTLIDFFCEDKETMKLEECFKIFRDFCERFKKAVKENRDREIQDLRQQQKLKELEEKRHLWVAGERAVFGRSSSENDVELLIKDGLHELLAFTQRSSQSPGGVKRTRSRRIRSAGGSVMDSHLLSFLQAGETDEQAKSNSIPRSMARCSRQRAAWQEMSETREGSLDNAYFDSDWGSSPSTPVKDSMRRRASAVPYITESIYTTNIGKTETDNAISQTGHEAANNNENIRQNWNHPKSTETTNINQITAVRDQLGVLEGLQIFNYSNSKAADSSQVTTCDEVTLTDIEYAEDLSLQTPSVDVSLQTPDTDMSLQTPVTDVSLQTTDTDMSIITHDTDVSLKTPDTDVSLQTPETDMNFQPPGVSNSSVLLSNLNYSNGEPYCVSNPHSSPQKDKANESTDVSILNSDIIKSPTSLIPNKECGTVFFVLGYTDDVDRSGSSEKCEIKAVCQEIIEESRQVWESQDNQIRDQIATSHELERMTPDHLSQPVTKAIANQNILTDEAVSLKLDLPKKAKQVSNVKQSQAVREKTAASVKTTAHYFSSAVHPKSPRTARHSNNDEIKKIMPISKSTRRSNSAKRLETKTSNSDELRQSQKATGSNRRDSCSKTPRRFSCTTADQKSTKGTSSLDSSSNSLPKRRDSLHKPSAKPVHNIPRPKPEESTKICRSSTRGFPKSRTDTGGTGGATERSDIATPNPTPNFARNTVASSSRRQKIESTRIPGTSPQTPKTTSLTRAASQRQTTTKCTGTNHTRSNENAYLKRAGSQKPLSKTQEASKTPSYKTEITCTGNNSLLKSTEKKPAPAADSGRVRKTPERVLKWK